MSKRVSNSCCYYGAAAQSKSLSVGYLEYRKKQAQRDAETALLLSQLNSANCGYRAEASTIHKLPPSCSNIE